MLSAAAALGSVPTRRSPATLRVETMQARSMLLDAGAMHAVTAGGVVLILAGFTLIKRRELAEEVGRVRRGPSPSGEQQ